jgi:hypothetical protein
MDGIYQPRQRKYLTRDSFSQGSIFRRRQSDHLLPFFIKGVAQIPAQAEKDDLGIIVPPLEEIGFGHR